MSRNRVTQSAVVGTFALLVGSMMQIRGLPPEVFSDGPQELTQHPPARLHPQPNVPHAPLNEVLSFLRHEKVYTSTMRLKSATWEPTMKIDEREGASSRGAWFLHFEDEDGTWLDIDVNAPATKYWDNTCRM